MYEGKLTFDGYNGRGGVCVWDDKLNHVFTAETPYPMETKDGEAKAAELVKRWNSQPELLKACEDTWEILELFGEAMLNPIGAEIYRQYIEQLKSAISLGRGE